MASAKQSNFSLKLSVFGAKLEDSFEITFNFPKDLLNHLIVHHSSKESEMPQFQKYEFQLDDKECKLIEKLFLSASDEFQLNEKKDIIMDGVSVSLYIGGQFNSVNYKFYNLNTSAEAGESIEKILNLVHSKLAIQ